MAKNQSGFFGEESAVPGVREEGDPSPPLGLHKEGSGGAPDGSLLRDVRDVPHKDRIPRQGQGKAVAKTGDDEAQAVADETRAQNPFVLCFPTVGDGKEWGLTAEKLAEYEEAYPDMDVVLVAKRARQWIVDHPRKRKTPRGMPAFLGSWMERQQNSGKYPLRDAPRDHNGNALLSENERCRRCGGTGFIEKPIPGSFGRDVAKEPCTRCQGTGRF